MSQILLNNIDELSLTNPVTAAATQWFMNAGDLNRLPASILGTTAAGDYILLTVEEGSNIEIIKVYYRASGYFLCVRAQEGTTAFAFTTGASISARYTAGTFDQTYTDIEEARGGLTASIFNSQISKNEPFIATIGGVRSGVPSILTSFSNEGNTLLSSAGSRHLSASNDAGTLTAFYDGTDILICSIAANVITKGAKAAAPTTGIASMTFVGDTLCVLGDPDLLSEVGIVAGSIVGTTVTWGAIEDIDPNNTIDMDGGMGGLSETSSSVSLGTSPINYDIVGTGSTVYVVAAVNNIEDQSFNSKTGMALLEYNLSGTSLSYTTGSLQYETHSSGASYYSVAALLSGPVVIVLTGGHMVYLHTSPSGTVSGTSLGVLFPDTSEVPYTAEVDGYFLVMTKRSSDTSKVLFKLSTSSLPPVSAVQSFTGISGMANAAHSQRVGLKYLDGSTEYFAEFTVGADASLIQASARRLTLASLFLQYSDTLPGTLAILSSTDLPLQAMKYSTPLRSGENFVGMAPAGYTSNGSHPVYTSGNVMKGLSGLTRGSLYYLDDFGNLTTTNTGTTVGLAIHSTEILLK